MIIKHPSKQYNMKDHIEPLVTYIETLEAQIQDSSIDVFWGQYCLNQQIAAWCGIDPNSGNWLEELKAYRDKKFNE